MQADPASQDRLRKSLDGFLERNQNRHCAEITRATELARECMASLGEKESVV